MPDTREDRVAIYSSLMDFDNIQDKKDEVVDLFANVIKANDKLISFDSAVSSDKINLPQIVGDVVLDLSKNVEIDPYKFDAIVGAVIKVADEVDFDSIGSVQGGEVVASLIKANIYTIISADVPFSGTISDMVAISGGKSNTKFKMLVVEPVVTSANAGFSEGDGINGLNAGDLLAFSTRNQTFSFETDTLTYTFNIKKSNSDTDNYKMSRGTNEVVIGGSIFIDDFEVSSTENPAKRVITVDNITYTVTFKYADGQIVLEISDNIVAGTKIYMEGALDTSKLSEIVGGISSDIRDYNYIAHPVNLDVKFNIVKARELLQNASLNIATNDMAVALSKISAEIKQAKINKAISLATSFGSVIDIANADESTIADRYKRFLIGVEDARSDISTKSGLTSNIVLVGGSALVRIYSALSTDSAKTNVVTSNENSIRFLGFLNGTIPCYFNPKHDIDYPTTDDKDKVFVVGNPTDPAKKPVVDGIGLPILPDDLGADADSNKTTRLSGKVVVSANKDPRARKQVRELTVKL
jgi:hypothetical protein